MAEAGFYHRPSDLAPDLAKCYVCQKELEGWEPTDDPWTEHRNHAKDCEYLKLQDPKNITVVQLERLEANRQINILRKVADGKIHEYKDYTKEARLELESLNSL